MTSAELSRPSPLQTLDRQALILRVSRGTLWSELEQALQGEGFTLGWGPPLQPDACVLSILEQGGRGLGSALYGAPLQNVAGIEARLSGGRADGPRAASQAGTVSQAGTASQAGVLATTLTVPRSAAGPDFKHLLLGAEGRFGSLTMASMRVYPLPRARCRLGWEARSLLDGLETLADAVLLGARPVLGLAYPLREGPASSATCILELAGELELVQALSSSVEARLKAGGKARAVTASLLGASYEDGGGSGPVGEEPPAVQRVCTALGAVLGTRMRTERFRLLHDPTCQVEGSWTQLRAGLQSGSSLPSARLILAQGHERALLLLGSSPDAAKWRSHLRSAVVSTGLQSGLETEGQGPRRAGLQDLLSPGQGGG